MDYISGLKKGKEVEILDSDVVMDVSPNLARTFHFKQMVKGGGDENWYGAYEETSQLGALIDEVFLTDILDTITLRIRWICRRWMGD